MPGSVASATNAVARAASTALPPSAATASPASSGLLAGGGDGDPADVGHVAHLGPRGTGAGRPSVRGPPFAAEGV